MTRGATRMVTRDQTREAVLAAVKANAEAATDMGNYTPAMTAEHARAAKDLAEAYAWLRTTAQPH